MSSALIWAIVPVMVTDEVPLFDTTAPLPPALTVSEPSPTESVTVSLLAPPSASDTDKPVLFRLSAACSVAP